MMNKALKMSIVSIDVEHNNMRRNLEGPMIGDRYVDMNFFWILGVSLIVACWMLWVIIGGRWLYKRRNRGSKC